MSINPQTLVKSTEAGRAGLWVLHVGCPAAALMDGLGLQLSVLLAGWQSGEEGRAFVPIPTRSSTPERCWAGEGFAGQGEVKKAGLQVKLDRAASVDREIAARRCSGRLFTTKNFTTKLSSEMPNTISRRGSPAAERHGFGHLLEVPGGRCAVQGAAAPALICLWAPVARGEASEHPSAHFQNHPSASVKPLAPPSKLLCPRLKDSSEGEEEDSDLGATAHSREVREIVALLAEKHDWNVSPEVEECIANTDLPAYREILKRGHQPEPGWDEKVHGAFLDDKRVRHLATGGCVFEKLSVYVVLVQLLFEGYCAWACAPRA
ncbi:unnamed protein product [Prorocentrum cordatum]|uniref:Uncharacterized protein n=1 Tax=Prorocentrum cordatum TaxID=2364126 RepID=A0ABN9TZ48_9DINO|nr:unnamed protein product [Polarella glacialis]